MSQTVYTIGTGVDLSATSDKATALSNEVSNTMHEFPNLTPDEQAVELYQLSVKCRELLNNIDAAYEVTAEFVWNERGA